MHCNLMSNSKTRKLGHDLHCIRITQGLLTACTLADQCLHEPRTYYTLHSSFLTHTCHFFCTYELSEIIFHWIWKNIENNLELWGNNMKF